ncbi:acetyl-CoA acetyltransferase [Actinoplanes sp. NPDC051633]|uniref:acetyl-CoA acetyltransferase n=1 Tax=Actinoplanes sp. NPDC051633 TaxID=3155670 RepID=UPI00341DF1B4
MRRRTPVIVGVGEVSERLDGPGYRRRSPVDLAADAAREALVDTGLPAGILAAVIDTVAGVPQFEISIPGATAPLGRSGNYPRSVAARIGARPRRAILAAPGGQGPQQLVNELAATIAAGDAEVVLLFGGEAMSTAARYAGAEDRPDWTEHADGDLEERGSDLRGVRTPHLTAHGMVGAPVQYAMIDNARRARLGLSRAEYAAEIGRLFAPFTRVAAAHPHAAAPVERTAAELTVPTAANRPIADPYTRYVVAREKVNQGAAVLLMSAHAAGRFGIPPARQVLLAGHADLRERELLERADLSTSPAAAMAVRHALEMAGAGIGDLATLDLYSCFPAPVFAIADAFGLSPDDPRGLTVTGGLPFFGGPGNNYSMHAIAETVRRARRAPGSFGLVGANGGVMSAYSAGVYTTIQRDWVPDGSGKLQSEVDSWPAPGHAVEASGAATVQTYTVKHDRDGTRTGIVIGRLTADGRRFVANADPDVLSTGEPIGAPVRVRSEGGVNRLEW